MAVPETGDEGALPSFPIMQDQQFKCEVYFLTTEEGGRKSGIIGQGYRGQLHYDEHDWDAYWKFNTCWALLGKTYQGHFLVHQPELHTALKPGKSFEIREGAKTIGRCKILSM